MTVRDAFRSQSASCTGLASPFMGRLMALFAERLRPGTPVADRVLDWPGDPHTNADSVPLRLAGALHALKLNGLALAEVYPPETPSDDGLWKAVEAVLEAHEDHLLKWLKSPPQTNEVRRSAVVLAGLGEVARRYPGQDVALFELGASGGLNLLADRYQLKLPDLTLGPEEANVVLSPEWTGTLPHAQLPHVTDRQGVDLAPLNPIDATDRLRFLAYLWPDQPERQNLTELALAEARTTPVTLKADDAASWLERTLPEPNTKSLHVVFHTVAWQYFPETTKARARAALVAVKTPTIQLGMEADDQTPGAAITLTEWPSGKITPLGRADFHGRWINWY